MVEQKDRVIGLSSATAGDPSTSDKFSFWLAPGVIVNPFDIVEVEQGAMRGTSRTFGIVTTLDHYTDAPMHLSNFVSNDFGQVTIEPNTVRQGTTVAHVAVLSNDQGIYMPVRNDRPVRFADEEGIRTALGIDQVPERYRVPAGLIEMSNGTRAVVYLDSRYILGPEGAHLNITGISGLATKTSYAIFLIQSILQKAENRDRIGVVILNVKHADLLAIDRPSSSRVEDRELWDVLGLVPKPFERVRYLLPCGKDHKPNSFRVPARNWCTYAYSLQDTYDKLDLLLSNIPDPYDTVEALIGEIQQGLSDPGTGDWGPHGKWKNVRDWNSLLFGEPLTKDGQAQQVGDVRPVSVGRFRRLLRSIVQTRQSGIFVDRRSKDVKAISQEVGKIRGGEVIVVDIARLRDEEQTLVFGDILRTIYTLYAGAEEKNYREDLPEKVIIFVDELNKYAPPQEKRSPIVRQVLDVAERGRSLGVVLFGAEQFMSAVHDRVVGNCSTIVIGRSGSSELSSPAYRFLDQAVKASVSRLQKGELVISHATFRQPVKIRFPRPAYWQEGT